MNYNDILKIAGKSVIKRQNKSLLLSNLLMIELDVVEHLEKELKPEYMNQIFTWAQIKKALEKHYLSLPNKTE